MSFTFEEADEYAAGHSMPATDVLRLLGEEIATFNEHVANDDHVECVLVPIRDGVTLIRRRP
jgi:predicted O-methyltransferase YrrM